MNAPCLIFAVILLVPGQSAAQEGSGSIQGEVRDLNGTPVAEASVYAIDYHNIRRRVSARADSNGRFVLRNLIPTTYSVHAYKESEGYPDTFVPFFRIGERKWHEIRLRLHGTAGVTVRLGPKYPVLELSIQDEQGKPVAANATLVRTDDREHPYHVPVTANARLLVPPVPFSFELKVNGFERWHSELISLRSGETHSLTVHLKAIR